MSYQPKPVDTSRVRLDPTLVELTEFLAQNTHEVWATGRLSEGWAHGPRATSTPNATRASCRTANCRNPRSSSTATRHCKRSS